jgi:hypothetical protein
VTGTLPVTAGTTLQVNVGQVGGYTIGGMTGSAFGGGGEGGVDTGGGGGASDVRDGSYGLADRLLVAGGGGGGGAEGSSATPTIPPGGAGGNADSPGVTGGSATGGCGETLSGGVGGGAGTDSAGGAGGAGGEVTSGSTCGVVTGTAGTPGGQGTGGNGGDFYGGGGGGGGYYGGGAGGGIFDDQDDYWAGTGGGGGGASFTGTATGTSILDGVEAPAPNGPNGEVIITYTLAVTTTGLPGGVDGSAYSQTLAAVDGVTPDTWSLAPGSSPLPPGLTLDASTGVISGTPTATGTYDFTVQVTDSSSPVAAVATQALSITVGPALAIATTSLPAATGGQAYSATLQASGGTGPYTWAVTSGSLPPGLTLNTLTGVISGTPDVAGTYSFTVAVTDSESTPVTVKVSLSITVSGPVITGIKPDSGPTYGDTPVVITGTGLSCPAGQAGCAVTVTFGGKPAAVVLVRADEIFVVSPPSGTPGTVTVTVTVGGVSSQATTATTFTYISPLP